MLVTGASSGIGEAVVTRLLDEGATVVAADVEDAVNKNRSVDFVRLDVGLEADWQAAKEVIKERHGGLDVLINNAGILRESPIADMPIEEWNSLISVNLTGVFLGCKTMVPMLSQSQSPAIVNLASIDALRGSRNHAAYAATKGGVVAMTRALAVELSDRGIRVNAICPGTVRTPMVQQMFSDADDPVALEETRVSAHPLGRISTTEEQAAAIVFMAGPDANFITGVALSVDGGRAIR